MMNRNQLIKKLIYWNFFLALLLSTFDTSKVIISSNIYKPLSHTVLFCINVTGIYFLILFSVSLFVIFINLLLKKFLKREIIVFKWVVILELVVVVVILLFQINLEPIIIETQVETDFLKDELKQNVVLITLDTLRQDHLSSTGNNNLTTPGIDYFSKRGITFSNAHCQIPVTTPSHSSILSGLNPFSHNSRNNGVKINKNVLTLPKFFSKKGYNTAAFVSSSTLKSKLSGLEKGFHYFDQFLNPRYFDQRLYLTLFGRVAHRLKLYQTVERSADRTYDSFSNWFKKNCNDNFFLWLHFFDPHAPYVKHEKISSVYYDGEEFNLKADYKLINSIYDGDFKPTDAQMKYLISLYDGEIMYVDRYIQKVIKKFKENQILDNTLFIVTADHGESLGEHDYYFYHGSKLYEPSMKVPLFFSGNSIDNTGMIVESLVRSIDIAPSIINIVDDNFQPEFEGSSLFPLEKIDSEKRLSYGENVNKFSFFSLNNTKEDIMNKKRALILNGKKYIENPGDYKDEFYNLGSDPKEMSNLIDTDFDSLEHKNLLTEIKKSKENYDWLEKIDLDDASLKDLKTLGYIE